MALGFDQGWEKGGSVFVNDDEEGWVEATIVKIEGVGRTATLTIKLSESGKMQRREAKEVEQASKLSLSGVEDMTTLDDLTEATVLSTLRSRYKRKEIYTNVGGILVAVNPYEKLPESVYGDECMFGYGGADVAFTGCAPHPYLLAESALRALDRDRESQSFVISGESGSGKTETCKYVLRYLSYRSKRRYEHSVSHAASDKRSTALEESVLLSNPILESFGNAKTNRNDNSSRWGKYTQVYVEPSSGAIERVGMTAYLLEKVRVVERSKGERNYHILYQMVLGIPSDDPVRKEFAPHLGLNGTDHAVLRDAAGEVKHPKGVDDRDTAKSTREALRVLNIDENLAFNALAAVCHLIDLKFKDEHHSSGSEGCNIDSTDYFQGKGSTPAVKAAAVALGVSEKELCEALISRRVAGVRAPRTAPEAVVANQAFAKALYSRLFDWILRRVNEALKALTGAEPTKLSKEMLMEEFNKSEKAETLTIGLLDIFGFEQFVVNSLEQLLINYANERLLREFNKQVFEAATKEYQAEGVPVGDLTFHDNSALLHTLENPRGGVFAMLNSECVRRDGSDTNFLANLLKSYNLNSGKGGTNSPAKTKSDFSGHGLYVPKVGRGSSQVERDSVGLVFGVEHFAADVSYTVTGFVEKNRDRVPDEICALVATSSRGFIASLFADVDENENGEASTGGSRSPAKKKGQSPAKSSKARRFVAANFAQSLSDLTRLLDDTNQSFVRCIKPNHKMTKAMFEGVVVLDQLRCMGMLELVEARRRGYARRIDHATFVSRYALLMEDEDNGESGKTKDAAARSSYASSIMAMVAGDDDKKKNGSTELSVIQKWEAKPGTPGTSKDFIKAIKPRMKNPAALDHMAVGKTKVFLKKEALDELESAREDRLRHDVLLALREATENRDALQLELTLRIADELRLGETDEARLARATLTDERAYQEIFHATVDACESSKPSAVDECLVSHNIPVAGDGDLDSIKKQASGKSNDNEELPFSSGQWFSGSSWSKYVLDAARVGRLARDVTALLQKLVDDPTKADLANAKMLSKASAQECKRYAKVKDDEEQRAPAVDALESVSKQMEQSVAKAEAKIEIAAALRAIRAATSAYDLAKLNAGLAAFDAIPPQRSGPLMNEKDEDTIATARSVIKQLTSLSKLDAETAALKKETSSDKKAKTFVNGSTAPTRLAAYDELIADVGDANGKAPPQASKSLSEANALSAKLKQLMQSQKPAAAAAAAVPVPVEDLQAKKAAAQKKEAEQVEERKQADARREAREKQQTEEAEVEKERKAKAAARAGPPEGQEMQNMSSAERAAIQSEENKRLAQRAPLFFDLEWKDRVRMLTKGSRMLKLSSTSSVQGAEWKHVRLETALDTTGESLLASDPLCKNPQARSGAFLTWPSNTMLRRGSRKLALASITGVHVGTNAKQWCTMVPTEWHYMTLTTPERSYDFGFESAALLLLWVNTLQRIIFPQWTRSCGDGQMSELFKGAISDAQHRFYRSSRAGASPSEAFKPSLPELCPVLYPIAHPLAKTCGELGVSFAADGERAQKFCMWTAVAVLEAPVPHDQAVNAMRAVLSDLGFYAEGRFACSAGFYDENGLAHTLAKDAIASNSLGGAANAEGGMLVIRAQHAKTGKVSVLKIKKGTKMASVFEAHAKHKGLRTQALSVVK